MGAGAALARRRKAAAAEGCSSGRVQREGLPRYWHGLGHLPACSACSEWLCLPPTPHARAVVGVEAVSRLLSGDAGDELLAVMGLI